MATHTAQPWVISGPTAVGKGTVVARLIKRHPEIWVSVSATTRPARPGEVDGLTYHFVTDDEFDELVAQGQMLEWACVHGMAKYGTPRAPVEAALAAGRTVILEIDLQGARQVHAAMPSAHSVFLAPPSWEELVHRLVGRGTETPAQQQRRLETAKRELAAADEFEHVIVNGELETTVDNLVSLLGLSSTTKG